jgi:hypothetical protein
MTTFLARPEQKQQLSYETGKVRSRGAFALATYPFAGEREADMVRAATCVRLA